MYYVGVAPAPLAHRRVIFLALLAASCSGNLNPIRARPPTGGDGAATGHDAASGFDASNIPCFAAPVGFATMSDEGGEPDGGTDAAPMLWLDGGVTGGGAATPVVVDATDPGALAQFTMYASDKMPGPLTIIIKGMISIPATPDGGDTGGEQIRVSSNKTVIGANVDSGGGSGFYGGGLAMTRVSNVIIQNLAISRPNTGGAIDAIHVEMSHQIWIDHCDLSSNADADAGLAYDGLIDISNQSDFVTISWTHYHDHRDSGLIGRSDSSAARAEDAGKEHVTYDHDWFSNVTTGPRIRFGTVHVLNTLFDNVAHYAVASTDGANVLIEASKFQHVTPPGQSNANFGPVTTMLDPPATAGYVDYRANNVTDSTDGKNVIPSTQVVPWPSVPYGYTPDSAGNVPPLVAACAGTGKIAVPSN